MQRRQFLTTLGATAAATTTPAFLGPVSLGSSDTLTDFALSSDADIDRFGVDANPSFVSRYEPEAEAGDTNDLREWVESHDDGRVIREYDTLDMIAYSVPWDAAGRRSWFGIDQFSGGLDDLEYVPYADANATLSIPDPLTPDELQAESEFDVDLRVRDRVSMIALLGSFSTETNTDGLAFDGDAPTASLRAARELSRAGDTLLESYDTSSERVCVIDTGANDASRYDDAEGNTRLHPDSTDFTDSRDRTVGEDGPSVVAAGDSSRHGDWVSACILADDSDSRYSGFAQEAELVAAKSLGDDGGGEVADILAGIDLAIATNSDVACLSLGSPQWSEVIADALAEAWGAGVFPVVAVGNDRYATTFIAAPASAVSGDETDADGLAVNATNVPESGEREDTQIAYFGNTAPHPGTQDLSDGASADAGPEIAAPGMNIYIEGIGTLTGTSMAAPMVVGAATVLSSAGYDNEQILERLTDHAYPLANAGITETEHGLLDLEAALEGTDRVEDQSAVRTDAARARDDFNEALSSTRGGFLSRLF